MAKANLAAPELAGVEIEGITRSAFIMRGAVAAGSVYGLAAVGPYVGEAIAQGGGGDVEVLNFALTLEFLEAEFYSRAPGQAKGLSGDVRRLARTFGEHEQTHVETLQQTIQKLGGQPTKAPKVSFPFRNEASFLKLAQTLEDTGVSAYNGAAPRIQSKEVLGAAGQIVQVEARHAAAIRLERGDNPAPEAFDMSLEMTEVLEAVKPFVKS